MALSLLPPPPAGRTGWPWTEASAALSPNAAWPRITIVTPSYQQGQFLEETIRSVLLQGYPNLEYIIIDGGSRDNSVEIIQKYAAHLTSWVSEKDRGQTHAVNKGFARSTGAIMGWLNSDDLLLPGALRHIAEAYLRDPAVSATCGFRKVIDANSRVMMNWFRGMPDDYFLQRYYRVAQETAYWRREVWEKIGPLDETYQYTMDYEYWQRIIAAGYHFTLLPYYLGAFRQHPASKGALLDSVREQEQNRIYQQYNIASSYEEALAQLDNRLSSGWRAKLDLLKELNHKSFSNSPYRMLLIYRLLNTPLLASLLLALYRFYRAIKPSHPQQRR